MTLVAPRTLAPRGIEQWPVDYTHDFDALIDAQPDAVMMLRVQHERMRGSYFPSPREYTKHYALSEDRFHRLRPDTLVMHPGPMNRGVEIASVAADSSQSTILDQVTHGVWVRMAVLYAVSKGREAQ